MSFERLTLDDVLGFAGLLLCFVAAWAFLVLTDVS